jgi:hypothetical protein
MNILVYNQNHKKCQNQILKSAKHDFSHVYFMCMWFMSKVNNFELSEYEQLTKWF